MKYFITLCVGMVIVFCMLSYNLEPHISSKVPDDAEYEINGHEIVFKDLDKRILGAEYKGTVYIENNVELDRVYQVCNHEMIHKKNPFWNETKVRKSDEIIENEVCYELVGRILNNKYGRPLH